jgi:CarD family transcriptional regulator
MKSSKGNSSGKTPSKTSTKSPVKTVGKNSAKMHVVKGNGKGAGASAPAAKTSPKVAVLPTASSSSEKKVAGTIIKSSLAERLVAARGVKTAPKTPVVVTPAAPKVNLKLVAKGVAKVAVSKITRSEPTSPLNHRDVSHRDPHATKVISAKFGSEGGSSGAIPSRPVLESRAGDSSSDPASFKAGDKIVYPGHGVGEIEGVRVTNLGGDVHHIYNIKILESGMKVMVPVSQAQSVGLRKIIDKKAIDEVYEILRDRDFKIDTQTWNRRFREYSQKIKTGSVFEIAIVLRDLSVLSADKELSFGEKKMLDMAESLLVSEIAIAKARPHDKIVGELRSLFV